MKVNTPERTNQNKYLKLQSNHIKKYKEQKDKKSVNGNDQGMGKIVSALCLSSCFQDLLAYAIKLMCV